MSYCVNCGVELETGVSRCPLCDTEVLNPREREAYRADADRPYPSKVEALERRAARRFFVVMATLMLLIPPVVSVICNVLAAGSVTWSAYVIGATAMAYVYVLVPFTTPRPHPWLCLILDCGVTLFFLFCIAEYAGDAWFLPLALPITLAATIAAAVVMLFFRKRFGKFVRLAVLLFSAAALCMAIDFFVARFLGLAMPLTWSLYVMPPCVLFGFISLVINRRARFKEEVKKRFFV